MKKIIFLILLFAVLLNTVSVFAEPKVYYNSDRTNILDENNDLWAAGGEQGDKKSEFTLVDSYVKEFMRAYIYDIDYFVFKNDGTLYSIDYKGNKTVIESNLKKVFLDKYGVYYIKSDNSLWKSHGGKEPQQLLEDAGELLDMDRKGSVFYKITENNELYVCGYMWNEYGFQSGLFDYPPKKLLDDVKEFDIFFGDTAQPYMVYLNTKNELYEIGEYIYGGDAEPYDVPDPFESGKKFIDDNVEKYYAATRFMFYLKKDGSLWHKGRNYLDVRQTGDDYEFFDTSAMIEDDVKQFRPCLESFDVLKNNGELVRLYRDYRKTSERSAENNAYMCFNYHKNAKASTAENIEKIIEGEYRGSDSSDICYFLGKDNTVYATGINRNGQLGLGEDAPDSIIINTPVECKFLTKFYRPLTKEEENSMSAENHTPTEVYVYLGAVLGFFSLVYIIMLIKE